MTPRPFTIRDLSVLGIGSGLITMALGVALPVLGMVEQPLGGFLLPAALSGLVAGSLTILLAWLLLGRRISDLGMTTWRKTQTLEKARSLLQVIVDNTPASLLLIDENRRVVEANRLSEVVHGANPLGMACHELFCQEPDPCSHCPAIVDRASNEFCKGRREHTDPITGEVLSSEMIPVVFKDGRRYVLIVEQIVTEQRKIEARMVHQEKMAAFGLLAAGIAHDMGNPLSSVEMNIDLLGLTDLPEEEKATVKEVKNEVGRLRRILRELVDFARRRRDESSEVSVQSVVEDALRLCRHDPRMKVVEVESRFDPEAPPVRIIEDHLVQVVLNLLLNALDSMQEGGVLKIALKQTGGRVGLEVGDSGLGMDQETLARCFEPLFTTKEPGKGTGLGLSICKDIVEAAGGSIEVMSAPKRGTRVQVWLPAVTGSVERGSLSRERTAGPAPSSGSASTREERRS